MGVVSKIDVRASDMADAVSGQTGDTVSISPNAMDATTADVEKAAMDIVMAIEQCCTDILEFAMSTAENIGQGMENCCILQGMQWEGAMGTAPAITAEVPDGMGGTMTVEVVGQKDVGGAGANNLGTIYAQQVANQCQQQQYSSYLYNTQYAAWLTAYQDWQQAQIVPQLVSMGLQIAALVRMYDEWTKYLSKTNIILCGLAEDTFPMVTMRYNQNKEKYDAHVDEYTSTFSGQLMDFNARLGWQCALADKLQDHYCLDGDGFVGYQTLEAQHTQNQAQNMANISEAAQWAIQDAKACVADFKTKIDAANSAESWSDAQFGVMSAQMEGLMAKTLGICEFLNMCGTNMMDAFTNNEEVPLRELLSTQVEDATACLAEIQDAITDADDCMQQQKELYETHLLPNQGEVAAAIFTEVDTLLGSGDLMLDCFTMAKECADGFKEKYEVQYEVCVDELAKKILEMACREADCHEMIKMEQLDLSKQCIEHWQDNYEDCDGILAKGIMEEAKILYDTRTDVFDEFIERGEKSWSSLCDHYWPMEQSFSQKLMLKAEAQICEFDDAMEKICAEACELLDWWKNTYQAGESITAPKVIAAGVTACEQQIDTYTKLDKMADDLCAKWFGQYLACDMTDILELCKLHDKRDVECEVDTNSQCVQEIADKLKECWLDTGLGCEKRYLQELCDQEKYTPEYCNLEDRAILHIRSQYDDARENLLRNSTRYCTGDLDWQLCKLETQQAKDEAAAIQAANRFERWWETRECDRRHRYKMDMIQVYQGFAGMAIEGFDNSTVQYDRILTQIHNRLSRSYTYLSQANQAGATTASSTAAGVTQSLTSIRDGQFYPNLFRNLKSDYLQSSDAMIARAQQQEQIGHNWASIATQQLERADSTAQQATALGLSTMQHGLQYKAMHAQQLEAARVTGDQIQSLGLQHTDRSRWHMDQSLAWKDREWQVVCDGIGKAQSQTSLAQNTLNQALQFQQHRDQLIQQCRNNGMESAATQLEMFNIGERKVERALASAEGGLEAALRTMQWSYQQRFNTMNYLRDIGGLGAGATNALEGVVGRGHNLLALAANNNQIGMNQKRAELCKMCDMLGERDARMLQNLLAFNAIGQGTGGLANIFGAGVANAADGIIGSLTNIVGAPPSILEGAPAPGGTQNITVQNSGGNPNFFSDVFPSGGNPFGISGT